MRKFGSAAVFVACLAAAPAALAGDFFLNSQAGRMNLNDSAFGDGKNDLFQAGAGYRWGIGPAKLGLEAGLGRLGEQQDQARTYYTDGYVDRDYSLTSHYAFIGANARIKPPLVPVYVIGRIGYIGMERKLDEIAVDHYLDTAPVAYRREIKENDGGTYAGVGFGTTILPLLDVGVMYNQYRYSQVQYDPINDEYYLSSDKRDAHSVTLTVEYRF